MFIASLIADIIRGMIYLHESPLKYHGSLCTSNCLIDSRWVVKLSDFGLLTFKKGAEDPPNLQTMAAKCQSEFIVPYSILSINHSLIEAEVRIFISHHLI